MVDACLVSVGVGAMFSALVPKMVARYCNAYPCRPWNFWFSFLIFWIARIRVVAICIASYVGVSIGMVKCCV